MALREGKDEIYRNEKHFLGNDIGQFLQAISRRPKLDPDEFQLFQRMNEVLMETVSETQLEAHLESLKGDLRSRISDAA
ncbi:MAG: hypothetical protein GTO63_23630 [Anaerolineae bacterium]|nr:hypothetical protein [Anaerolineae bacterium]NIN97716.1 hypothetical protein [Anaerolineae bacterium]